MGGRTGARTLLRRSKAAPGRADRRRAVTRRKHPPPKVDPDNFGFDIAGKGFRVTRRELLLLTGADAFTCALYMRCLKPFADRTGAVRNASYYRFGELLRVTQSPAGGPRLPEPTKWQLRRALTRLMEAGLVTNYPSANRVDGALKIRLNEAPRTIPSC